MINTKFAMINSKPCPNQNQNNKKKASTLAQTNWNSDNDITQQRDKQKCMGCTNDNRNNKNKH